MAKRGGDKSGFDVTQDVMERVFELASQGLTEEQVAHCLGFSFETLKETKRLFPELGEAIERGVAHGIQQVSNTVYQKAVGGDLSAAIFFLKCRGGWADKTQERASEVPENKPKPNYAKLTEAELDRIIQAHVKGS